jgi:sec-independent protein translocase protein TatA
MGHDTLHTYGVPMTGALKPWHIIVLVVVLVLLFGAKRLPDAARSLGRSLRIIKAETKGLVDDDKDLAEKADAQYGRQPLAPDSVVRPNGAPQPGYQQQPGYQPPQPGYQAPPAGYQQPPGYQPQQPPQGYQGQQPGYQPPAAPVVDPVQRVRDN